MDQPLPPWPTGFTMSRSGRTIKTPKKYLHDPNEVINPSVKQAAAAVKAAVPVVLKPSIGAVAATRSRASSRREAGAAVPGSSSVRPASAPLLGQPRAQLAAQPEEPSQAQSAHAIEEHKDVPQAEPRKCNIRNCPSTRLAERIPNYIPLFEEAVACTFRMSCDHKACGYKTQCKYHLVEHVYKTHVEGHHFLTDEVSEQFDSKYYTLCHDCGIYDDKLEDHLKKECDTCKHTVMIAKRYQPRITSSDREKYKNRTTRQDIEDKIEACDHGSSDDDDDDDKDASHIIKPNDPIGNKNQYLVERFTSCSHYKWQGVIFMVKFLEYEDAPSKELLKDLHCYRIIQKFCAEKQAEKGRILTRKAKPVSSDVLEARKNSMVFSKEDYFDAIHDWNFNSGELLVFFKFMTDETKKDDQDEAYYYQRVAFWVKLDRLVDLDDDSCAQGVANFIDEQVLILRQKMHQFESKFWSKMELDYRGQAAKLEASKSVNDTAAAVAATSTASIAPESPLSQDHGYHSMPGGTAPSSSQKSGEHHKKTDEDDSSNKHSEEPMNTEEQSNWSASSAGMNYTSISRLLSTGISGKMPVTPQPPDNKLKTVAHESEGKLQQATSINQDISKKCTGSNDQMASGSGSITTTNNTTTLSSSSKRSADDANDGALKFKKVKTDTSSTAGWSSFASIKPVAITEQADPDNENNFQDSHDDEAPNNDPVPNVSFENELKNGNKMNSLNVNASAATDDAESCSGNLVIDEDDACGDDRDDLIGQNIKDSEKANMPPTNDAVNINNESSKAEEQAPTSCGTEERNKDKKESNMEAESKPQNQPKMTSLINECNEDSSDGILNKVKKRSDGTSLSLMAITLKNSESSAQPDELPSGGTEELNEKNKISASLNGLSKRSADDSNDGALQTKKQKTCASSTTGSSSSASIEPIVVNKNADGENENLDNQADEDIEAPENYSSPNVVLPNIGYNQMNLHIGMANVPSVIDYDDNSIPALIIDEDEETNQEIDKVMHNEQSEPSEELASTSIDSQEKSDEKDGSKNEVKQPEMSQKEFLDGKFNEGKKHETVGNLPRDEEKTIEQASKVSLTDRTSNNNESSEHLDVLHSTSAATDKENNEEIESTIDKVLKKGQSEQSDKLASTPVGSQEQADEKDESKKEMNQPEETTKESSTIIEDEGKEDDEDGISQSDLKIFDELVSENSEIDDFQSNRESKLSLSFVHLGPVTQIIHSHEHIEKATSFSEVKMQSLNDDEVSKGDIKEITDEIIEKVSKESVEFADMLTLDEQPSSSFSSSLSSSESQSLKTDPSNDSSAEINISFNEQNVFAANQINEQATDEMNNVANINIFKLIPVPDIEENFPPQYNEHINMANNFDFNNNNNNNLQYFGNVVLPLQVNINENNGINDLNEELQLPPSHGINLGAEMIFEFDEFQF